MSRYYHMELWVDAINQDRRDAIRDAANAEWEFTNWDGRDEMRASSDDRQSPWGFRRPVFSANGHT